MVESFEKTLNDSIIDLWQDPKYASTMVLPISLMLFLDPLQHFKKELGTLF